MKRLAKCIATAAALLLMSVGSAFQRPAAAFQEAVYTGPAPYGPNQLPQYQTWLGSTGLWAEDFEPTGTWSDVEDSEWLYGPWGTWEKNNPSGNILLGIPLIPGDGSTLAACASGAYNSHFTTLCSNMQKFGLTRAILRVGWEMNLGYTKWNAAQDQANWVPAFKQAANTIHAYNSAHGTSYKVCWNPSNGWGQQATDQDWNGLSAQYVDYIGVDVYDDYPHGGNGSQNEYANTSGSTYQPNSTQQAQAWADYQDNYGLSYYTGLSQSTGIPLIVPEWGVWGVNEGRPAGGDNPLFIQNMYNWFKANNIAIECYFDVYAGDGDHQLWPGPNNNTVSEFPNSKAMYLSLFKNGGSSTANYLTNPGFETGSLSGWNLWVGSNGGAAFAQNCPSGEAHTGSYEYTNWASSPYQLTLYQSVSLPNGTHTVSAWIKSSGGQTTCRMEVSGYGGSTVYVNIPASNGWTKISKTVSVTSSTLTVGFYSQASANQWLNVDDVIVY